MHSNEIQSPPSFICRASWRIPAIASDVGVIGLTLLVCAIDRIAPSFIFLTGFYFLPLFLAIWFARPWAAVTVLAMAMGMTLYESWELVPADAGWWLNAVEQLSFAIIFPVVAGLISYAKRTVAAMADSNARLERAASVFHNAREGIMITDAEGTIVDINETFTRITGFAREEVIGRNPRILKSNHQSAEFYAGIWQAIREQGEWSGEIWNRRKNGEIYAELLTISAVRDRCGRPQSYIGLFSDITPMREHQKELERIAHYDPLTALPNRVLLADRLQQALAACHRNKQFLAVVFLDLDGFKAINDTHGHDTGDALLVKVASGMKEALREEDTLARIGGDEFVAILQGLSGIGDCEPVLNRLLAAASAPVHVAGNGLRVSASIGVAFYPQDGEDADHLLRHADQAMYIAKQAGKNRYHLFDAAQNEIVKTRHEMIDRIRLAMERDEFELHYQPKVNMRTRQFVGTEALIRWRHPEKGLLPPAAFLPQIENEPIGLCVGEWVTEAALGQMDAWLASGLRIPVGINVSAGQLQQKDFTARLGEALARHPAVRPHDLLLEILETSALDDMAHVTEVMRGCQALGVRFALDDFGTGYSSLTYLKRLPAEQIKIDQSFVRNMLDDPGDLAIVEGVLGLASAFRREVIAEGVETEAHGARLLQAGCELAQGYGIARPMPAIDIPGWIARWNTSATNIQSLHRPLHLQGFMSGGG
jgi:diguanylate cyclase (GGDEF)-like protein/PAS domain S-box-containing protein